MTVDKANDLKPGDVVWCKVGGPIMIRVQKVTPAPRSKKYVLVVGLVNGNTTTFKSSELK